MIRVRPILLAGILSALVTGMATSQISPTQTVQAAFDAYGRSDWSALGSLVHPDALTAFRTAQLGSAVGFSLAQNDPQMRGRNIGISPSDFVSEDAIKKAEGIRVAKFPGKPTIGELARLSPKEFFVRWCQAAVQDNERGPWLAMQRVGRQIIGEIIENDTLAHVMYRVQIESIYLAGKLEVMSLKKADGRWLMLLNDDVVGISPSSGRSEPLPNKRLKLTARVD